MLSAKEQDGVGYLMLGIEAQIAIHYAMPARCLLYDALRYERQLQNIASEIRDADRKSMSNDEFLSKFRKTDRLIPVITLVVFLSPKEWDGPRCLYDMFDEYPDYILQHVANYEMNLFIPAEADDKALSNYDTELGAVFKFIKLSQDKTALTELVSTDERFKSMDKNAVHLLNNVTKSNFKINESEEVVDVCQAIKDIRTEERRLQEREDFLALLGRMRDNEISFAQMITLSGKSEKEVVEGLKELKLSIPS